jgi:hypothetical protein
MLPFLKKKNEGGSGLVASAKIKDGEVQMEGEVTELEVVADELIQAIQQGDVKAAAEALKSAFIICDSYPQEGPQE